MNPTDPTPETPPVRPVAEPDDFKAMMIGAGFILVLLLIPYSFLLLCLPKVFGAFLTLHLFTRAYHLTISLGDGIKLGILTAILGGLAYYAIYLAVWLLFNYQLGLEQAQGFMLKIANLAGPDTVKQVKDAFDQQKAQGVNLETVLIGICMTVVNSFISGSIGGAIGAALFKRNPASLRK